MKIINKLFIGMLALLALTGAAHAAEDTPLFEAIRAGDKAAVEALLAGGADVNARDHWGNSPLYLAANLEKGDIVKALLAKGADPKARTAWGSTALNAAASKGSKEIIVQLLAKGADVQAREDYCGWSALQRALYEGKKEVVDVLIAAGGAADSLIPKGGGVNDKDCRGKAALHYAAQTGNRPLVDALLARNADLNAFDGDKKTVMHYAAQSGNKSLVEFVAGRGLDTNADAGYYGRPVHYAALSGNKELVEWFVAKGADLKAKDGFNRTVLHYAAQGGNTVLATWLLSKGADLNAKSYYGAPVHLAAGNGRRDMVKLLISRGADLKGSGESEKTVLHYAAASGDLELVEWLVAKGADVRAKSTYGETALLSAISKDRPLIEWLIKHGADVNAKAQYYGTPLSRAAAVGDRSLMDLLIANGADLKMHEGLVLYAAATSGKVDLVEWLLGQGLGIMARNDAGETALHGAAGYGKIEMATWLLAHGADVNAKSKSGGTPLYNAARQGKEMAELLLAKGADVNAVSDSGDTPLHNGAIDDRKDLIQLLIARGANVNARNKSGRTPLYIAVYYGGKTGNLNTIDALLDAKADVNIPDNDGKTALAYAAGEGRLAAVQKLAAAGASVNAAESDGRTPLHRAAYSGDTALVNMLLAAGADINARRNDGETPLLSAVSEGKRETVESLLAKGADINAKKKDGETPLISAVSRGQREIVELLLAKGADINAKGGYYEGTALHEAAYGGFMEIAELLLARGADINAKNKDKHSPLFVAAERGKVPLVELFMTRNPAGFDDKDEAILWALRYGRKDVIAAFVARGMNVREKNKDGNTPLHEAAYPYGEGKDAAALIEFLIAKGADVNARTSNGDTPLFHTIISSSWKEPMQALLAKGADVNARSNDGSTPLYKAAGQYSAHKEMIEILLAHGADINAKTNVDNGSRTPLQAAEGISDVKLRGEIVSMLQAAMLKTAGNPRELFNRLLADLKAQDKSDTLRKSVFDMALKLQPRPAVPAEAEQFEGRAQAAFRNARNEQDMLNAAREYMKAVDLAPWIANYYDDLCTILEKANRPAEALRACQFYLMAAPDSPDASETRKRIAGMQYIIETQEKSFSRRHECVSMPAMYEVGAKVAQIGNSKISVKLMSALNRGVWRNQLWIADITSVPQNIYGQRYELNAIDTTFQLEDRVAGTPWYRLTITRDGRITFGGAGSPQAEISTSTDELQRLRNAQLENCTIAMKYDGKFFVLLGQGGSLTTNDGSLVAGGLFFETDCHGALLGDKPGWLPVGFDPHPDTPGANREQSYWKSETFYPATADSCRSQGDDGLRWLAR